MFVYLALSFDDDDSAEVLGAFTDAVKAREEVSKIAAKLVKSTYFDMRVQMWEVNGGLKKEWYLTRDMAWELDDVPFYTNKNAMFTRCVLLEGEECYLPAEYTCESYSPDEEGIYQLRYKNNEPYYVMVMEKKNEL